MLVFFKPFSQLVDSTVDRNCNTSYRHLFQHNLAELIAYEKLTQLFWFEGETDELLKKLLHCIAPSLPQS